MCMGSANVWDSPYVFTSKVHYYIMGANLLCTNYTMFFFSEVENLKPSPNYAYKWFCGMLIHYTLQKITMGHIK
jgi:hypothetical protein